VDADQMNQFLTFNAAGEEYALGVLEVKEIVELTSLTHLPSAPPSVRGVVNLRGRVVPVIDLGTRFGLAAAEVTKRTCVIMVEGVGRSVIGVLADSVKQVMDLPPSALQPPPALGTRVSAELVKAMAAVGEKFVLVLDLAKVLRVVTDEETAAAGALPSEPPAVALSA